MRRVFTARYWLVRLKEALGATTVEREYEGGHR